MSDQQDIAAPSWERYLRNLYFDPAQPGSFQSPGKLQQSAKQEGIYPHLGRRRITRWLQNQPAYGRNRLYLPKSIQRSRVITSGLYDQFDADLADYQRLEASNDGYRFLLVVIDVFSRYLWVVPLKTKMNPEVIRAFEVIFQDSKPPRRLRTDRGGEFIGAMMNDFYKHYNITHFNAQNEVKANYAERVIRTLKSKLSRYMTHQGTNRYIDVLQDIVASYNATYHKKIKMPPKDVTKENESSLWWFQYQPRHAFNPNYKPKPYRFHIREYVRIPEEPHTFHREWHIRWTEEIFRITDRYRRDDVNVYKLEDQHGEEILGTFYEGELQRVLQNNDHPWQVERIVEVQGQRAKVKFHGWPNAYNRWISLREAQRDLRHQH